MIKKVKSTVLWTDVISALNDEETSGMFYVKELQKRKSNRGLKVSQRKGDKPYVKWKSYNNLINILINK